MRGPVREGVVCRRSVLQAVAILALAACPACAARAADAPAPAAAELKVKFTEAGLESLSYGGRELVAPGEGKLIVNRIDFRGKDNKVYPADLGKGQTTVDDAAGTVATRYPWGSISCTYKKVGSRLDILIQVQAAADTSDVLWGGEVTPLKLLLPDERSTPGVVDNDGALGYRAVKFDKGQLVLCNWEVEQPAPVSIAARSPQDKGFPLKVVLPTEATPAHPIIADKWFHNPGRPVAPGKTDEYHFSLHFGPADAPAGDLCKEFLEHFRKQRPMTLKWPDRRPMGRIFLCNSMTGWKTNPRGYLFGKGEKNDVTTPEGLEEFKADLLKHADRCVKVLREGDCQGVILWDLEGAEFWHPITYVGNPQEIAMVSPEMDQCADAFFKKFTDAGLKVGLCIRPTEIFTGKKTWIRLWHRDVLDPVDLMSRKIQYARKRWGCTIFYLDSNTFGSGWDVEAKGVPWVMPKRMIQELNRRHPDVLVIPEWELGSYYAASAPYKAPQLGQIASNANAKTIWPECFSVLAVSTRLMEEHWDTHVSDVVSGDILFWDGWYPSGENAMVKRIYREASYVKAGPPPSLAKADLGALAAASSDKDPVARFFAVRALGRLKDAKAVAALGARLADEDPLVAKNAVVALAEIGRIDDPNIVAALLDLLKARKPETSFLRSFVARALGAAGEAAVKPLAEVLAGKDRSLQPYALQALGATGTSDAAAIDAVLAFLGEAEKDNYYKLLAVRALGALKAKAAVEKLLPLLQTPDEELSSAAVGALGNIGDTRAVEPLIKLYDRPYHTVVVYRIRGMQDDALRQITGQKLSGKGAWEEYWKKARK